MENVKLRLFLIPALIMAVSCGSQPQIQTVPAQNNEEKTEFIRADFDPDNISREQYASTMAEVQQFIDGLNRIIYSGNYDAWKAALSPEFFEEIASPENLQRVSESTTMKAHKIVLKTPEDYFIHVVVPSRTNSRVDDIEFINQSRVKAYTLTRNKDGQDVWLRLYDLEQTGNMWRIIN
ncbi:MAG: hypothetical protein LBG91_01860 [Treponema sp.]|jgi:hypothetical protein|nr:hypothetical protein [Treponema sp.]